MRLAPSCGVSNLIRFHLDNSKLVKLSGKLSGQASLETVGTGMKTVGTGITRNTLTIFYLTIILF